MTGTTSFTNRSACRGRSLKPALASLVDLVPQSRRVGPTTRSRPTVPECGDSVSPAFALRTLADALPDGSIVIEEAPSHRAIVQHYLPAKKSGANAFFSFCERHDVSRGVIKILISMGLGISLVLESDTCANFSGLIYRELRDGTGPSRVGFSTVWREDNENPALANFLKLLSERYPFLPEA